MASRSVSKVTLFVLFSGLLGAFLASWLAPRMIAWYFDPPVNIGINCKAATEWSMGKLQIAQLVGLALGAVIGLVIRLNLNKRELASDIDHRL